MAEAMTAPVDDLVFDDPDWDKFLADMEAAAPDDASQVDGRIDWWLEQLRANEVEEGRNVVVAKERHDMISDWFAGEAAKLERQRKYIVGHIGQLVPPSADAMVKEYGKKSRALPNGTVGYRARPDSVDISDPKEALAFAVTNNLPVKTTHSVSKTVLKDHAKATGEMDGLGWHMVPGTDEFFVKAAS